MKRRPARGLRDEYARACRGRRLVILARPATLVISMRKPWLPALIGLGLAWLSGCATHSGITTSERDAASWTAPAHIAESEAGLDAAARSFPVAFLDRIGWGANAAELQELSSMGAARLLDEQLDPGAGSALPPQVAAELASLEVNVPLTELIPPIVREEQALRRRARSGGDAERAETALRAINQRKAELARQAMAQQLLLAVYAHDQLRARLTWFWLNHFNVFRDGNIGPMMADYSERVIAPHALGRFRDLLAATMFSPQMLLYLNNAQNARDHVNENYAREVMELHTLGVGNGYTQADVTHLAYALTGLGVDLADQPTPNRPARRAPLWRRGLVVFNPARHDPRPTLVLGHLLAGEGLPEIERVITLLADSPATARHVSFELAQYFLSDPPDSRLVEAMAATWERSHGDIAAVLRTLFLSPQFAASLSQPLFKDPMRYVLSAVRASFDDRIITDPQPMIGMLQRLAEPLYGRQTPDGYPLSSTAWKSAGQLIARFEVARAIAAGAPGLFRVGSALPGPVASPTPSGPGSNPRPPAVSREPPPELSVSAVYRSAEPTLRRATLAALADSANRVTWNTLWLASPEFMND
jgi:uncharacterized protein (DUF1800 family)